jgi:hypothetical protein
MLIISAYETFPVSKQVADIMPLTEVCPRFCQLPSKQVVICDESPSSFSHTNSLAACIMENSLISTTAEATVLLQTLKIVGGCGICSTAHITLPASLPLPFGLRLYSKGTLTYNLLLLMFESHYACSMITFTTFNN